MIGIGLRYSEIYISEIYSFIIFHTTYYKCFSFYEQSGYPVMKIDSHTDYKHTWHLHV